MAAPYGTATSFVGLIASYRKTDADTAHLLKLANMKPKGRPEKSPAPLPHRARQLKDDEITRAVELYEAGASLVDIAREFAIHRTTLSSRLVASGVTIRETGIDDELIQEAARRYEAGESLAAIGKKLGFSPNTIRTHLIRSGVEMRSVGRR